MSSATVKPTSIQRTQSERFNSKTPACWIVLSRELHALWIGGKAPILLLLYSIVMGFSTFVTAYNIELSLMPPKEMVYETLKTAITAGIFIGLIIAADSISGERERGTLEAILLTPANRRQIVIGKFLAALSPWPIALLLAIPYMMVLSQEDEVIARAIPLGAILGTVLAIGYTGLAMFVSFWCNTNRTSYLVNMGIYVMILVPAQLPGRAQAGAAEQFLQWVNPLAAVNHFLSKTLVNYRTIEEFSEWLTSPALFAIVPLILLFLYAAPNLSIEGGKASLIRPKLLRSTSRIVVLFMVACLLTVLGTSSAKAQHAPQSPQRQAVSSEVPLQVTIDKVYEIAKAGDAIFFDTVVTNIITEKSRPIIVAMNIINLDQEGDVVDPEVWSPERTQYIDELAPGQSATLSWRINTIVDGDYIVYMVAMPEPAGRESSSSAVASPGIHLTVAPFTRLNPQGILPLSIGIPVVIGIATGLLFLYRRRSVDLGGSKKLSNL